MEVKMATVILLHGHVFHHPCTALLRLLLPLQPMMYQAVFVYSEGAQDAFETLVCEFRQSYAELHPGMWEGSAYLATARNWSRS
eukprot:3594453-Pyramimonas_sp.AAC.2